MPVIGVLGAVSPEFRPVQLNLAGFREGLGELGFVEGQTGLRPPTLCPAGTASGLWDGRRDHVHCFELRLADLLAVADQWAGAENAEPDLA